MVIEFESEIPNLSYVRINSHVPTPAGESIRGYITKGLQSTDLQVVNSGILAPELMGKPALPELSEVAAPYWPSDALEKERKANDKKNASEKITENSQVTTTGHAMINHPDTGQISVKPKVPETLQASPKAPITTTSVATGVKRSHEDQDSNQRPKIPCIADKLVLVSNRAPEELVDENQRLARDNAALRALNATLIEKNKLLQGKLELLTQILKDPCKRSLLNARLQQQK